MGALMLERLQELHRRLQALSHAFPGEDPHRAAEEVVRVVREVWPDFLGNLSGRLGPGLVDDLAKVEEGQWPEDPGYAFLLHQVRRLTSPGPLSRQEGMADRCPACGGCLMWGFWTRREGAITSAPPATPPGALRGLPVLAVGKPGRIAWSSTLRIPTASMCAKVAGSASWCRIYA